MAFRRKPLVLIVDDDPAVAKTLDMLLRQEGYRATIALSSRTAIEMLSRIAADIALVEVTLPKVDGIKTALEIRKRLPRCKILLTASSAEAVPILERAKKDGMNFDVFAKPILIPELLTKLGSLTALPK